MQQNVQLYRAFKEVEIAHATATHALREYREWRNNAYLGKHLGDARYAYLAILRRRCRRALEAYRLMRMLARCSALSETT